MSACSRCVYTSLVHSHMRANSIFLFKTPATRDTLYIKAFVKTLPVLKNIERSEEHTSELQSL